MSALFDITAYSLEVDWLLTWFPTRRESALDGPQIRGGTFQHRSNESVFEVGNSVVYPLGQGVKGEGDAFLPPVVAAFIEIRVNSEGVFEADLDAAIGASKRSKVLTLTAGSRVPFLINIQSHGDVSGAQNTALAFQGVLVAAPRFSLLSLVARAFGP